MKFIRSVIAGLVIAAPAVNAWAQGAADPALASYINVEFGTGKVGLDCSGTTLCSRVDSSGIVRLGHRFDPSWGVELTYAHIDADWGALFARRSAELTGYGLAATYTLPMSDSVSLLLRAGALSNQLKFQPGSGTAGGVLSSRTVKPHLGLGAAWQFARRWSLTVNADWTRGEIEGYSNTTTRQTVAVRLLDAGVAFHV